MWGSMFSGLKAAGSGGGVGADTMGVGGKKKKKKSPLPTLEATGAASSLQAPGENVGGMGMQPVGGGGSHGGIQFSPVPQQDGSIYLHVQNSDGSLGPVARVMRPITQYGFGGY